MALGCLITASSALGLCPTEKPRRHGDETRDMPSVHRIPAAVTKKVRVEAAATVFPDAHSVLTEATKKKDISE